MENKENTVEGIDNETNIKEQIDSEFSKNEIKECLAFKKLPFYFKWWFIFVMYILFFYVPVVPIALNIGRLLFNKKYPSYKNKGGRKTAIALIVYVLVSVTIAIIITSVNTKRYNEVMDTINSGNYEKALVMLNENYSDLNSQEDISLWYYYYCETKEYNSAAELYLDLIEKSTDILTCKNNIEKIENIKNKLNEENKARFKNIKASYTEALKQAETTAVITTKKETENTTVVSEMVEDNEKTTKENKVTEEITEATTKKEDIKSGNRESSIKKWFEDIFNKDNEVRKNNNTDKTEMEKQNTTKKEAVSLSEDKNNSKEKEEFIKLWIEENIGESDNIKERKVKKLKKVANEELFYSVFMEMLKNDVESYNEASAKFIQIVRKYCKLYTSVWKESNKMNKLIDRVSDLEKNIEEYEGIVEEIGFDVDYYEFKTSLFYVSYKYADSKFDSINLVSQKWTKWSVRDVQYVYTTAIAGDNYFILLVPKNKSFPNSGAYTIEYIDIKKNVRLEDKIYGFVKYVPVYIMVDDNIVDLLNIKEVKEEDNYYLFSVVKNIINGKDVETEKNNNNERYKYADSVPGSIFNGSVEIPYKVCTGGSNLNVRSGCGQEYEVVGKLQDGCDIDVLAVYNGWAYIIGSYGVNGFAEGGDYKELYGWVSADYIEIIPYSP